jgi:hypothetical protein
MALQGAFPSKPTTVNVGGVRSAHHKVALRVRSVLDVGEEAAAAAEAPRRDDCLRSVAGADGGCSQPAQARLRAAWRACCMRLLHACAHDARCCSRIAPQATHSDARVLAASARGGAQEGADSDVTCDDKPNALKDTATGGLRRRVLCRAVRCDACFALLTHMLRGLPRAAARPCRGRRRRARRRRPRATA